MDEYEKLKKLDEFIKNFHMRQKEIPVGEGTIIYLFKFNGENMPSYRDVLNNFVDEMNMPSLVQFAKLHDICCMCNIFPGKNLENMRREELLALEDPINVIFRDLGVLFSLEQAELVDFAFELMKQADNNKED